MTPVNVVTGCLGAGKTTAIARALARRPEGETWAVVVNDFGALGIDGALLDDAVGSTSKTSERGGVVVREVNGGCVCCATAAPFTLAVTQVLRRFAPDRVLVEPSGVGDAGRVIDALRSEHLKRSVDVRATVCVVDVREFGSNARSGVVESELFKSQCECAETLCGAFADVADFVTIGHASAADEYASKARLYELRRRPRPSSHSPSSRHSRPRRPGNRTRRGQSNSETACRRCR